MAFPLTVISVTVDDANFQPLTGNGLAITPARFAIVSSDGGVTLNGNALEVYAKSTLVFTLPPTANHTYTPQDLWFLQTGGAYRDADGKLNLKDKGSNSNYPNAYEVSDHIKTNYTGARWKILIPISRDDGLVGLIDPEITNTGEETKEERNPPFNRPAKLSTKSAGNAKAARKAGGGKKSP